MRNATRVLGLLFVVIGLFGVSAEARKDRRKEPRAIPVGQGAWVPATDDAALSQALSSRRRAHYIEAGSLVVAKILPDDNQGLRHQKFVVRLQNGAFMTIVSNLEFCRVPVAVGDVISAGGEFIWTRDGGLLHWVHRDPQGRRPNGYIHHRGLLYCN